MVSIWIIIKYHFSFEKHLCKSTDSYNTQFIVKGYNICSSKIYDKNSKKKPPQNINGIVLLQGIYIKILKITWLPHIHTHKHRKGETKEQMGQIKINRKMVDLNPTISLIKWNVNWLNTSIKRQRLWYWGEKNHNYYMLFTGELL